MSRVRPWTDEEKAFLREHAGSLDAAEIAHALGRSPISVAAMLGGLANAWTPEEDAFIRATAHMTSRQVAARMPGRSYEAVRTRRQKLGARAGSSNKDPNRAGRRTLIAKTCPKCGLLLDASWYTRTAYGNWVTDCSRCKPDYHTADRKRASAEKHAREQREFVAKQQALTAPYAVNAGQPYTDKDQAVLADPDLTNTEKALALGRTYSATAEAVHRYGFRSKRGKGDPMKGRWIIDNPNAPQAVAA